MSNTTSNTATVEAAPLTAEAERLRSLFQAAAERELPAMATAARLVLRAWAEAEMAIQAARQSGEPGASDLPSAEAFRVRPCLPREEVSRERIVRWLGSGRQPLDDETDRQAMLHDGSWVVMYPGTSLPRIYLGERAEFERVTYQEAQGRLDPPTLFGSLSVPAIVAGGNVGWEPTEHLGPADVLARLDKLDAWYTPYPAARQRTVEHILLHRVGPPQAEAAASVA